MSANDNDRTVNRDVSATAVPYGETVTIPKGTKVTITHRLGGNFTLVWAQGMVKTVPELAAPASPGKPLFLGNT